MKIRLLTLTALLLAVWMSPPGLAAESIPFDLNDPAMLIKLSEAGGPTLAILLSMHWLRENYQRRLEENQLRLQESQRYSENLALLQKEHREELRRVRPRKKLRSSGKEVTQDE